MPFKKYSSILISIPEEFFQTLETFDALILLDPRYKKEENKEVKNEKTIRSIVIRDFMSKYVNKYSKRFLDDAEGKEHEEIGTEAKA